MLKIITDLKRRIKERNNPLTAEYAYTLRKYDRKLTEEQVNEIMQNQELEPNEKVLEVMNLIGGKRGAIISGGEINIEKVANIIIDDFRSGRLGRITLETVKGE